VFQILDWIIVGGDEIENDVVFEENYFYSKSLLSQPAAYQQLTLLPFPFKYVTFVGPCEVPKWV
jgi:hypothetical protein